MLEPNSGDTTLVGITWDGEVRVMTSSKCGVSTQTMTPNAARFIANELIAAAERADLMLVKIQAGVKSETRV